MAAQKNYLYTLIPLEDFKALLGVDDREEKLAKFCLVTATLTIEQYCKRKLLRKKYFEKIDFNGDLFVPLREYGVYGNSGMEKCDRRLCTSLSNRTSVV